MKIFPISGNLILNTHIHKNKNAIETRLLLDDQQLITCCRKNDSEAQKLLYEKYAPKMLRLCFRYTKNELDAEEVLISGFVKVFQHLDKFEYRGGKSFEGWVKRIMVNESLMLLRKRNNFNLVAESNAEQIEAQTYTDSNLAAEEIYALVLKLPTGYRTVFNLYAIEGYSHKEIAEQLNISINTSKSQLSKARAMLKKLLIKNGIHHER
ncbi:sigma-70 family RNA polymerase sigma factor [Rapidithrix thailandica]|uniref:Sigma-70 family RNA polymerase sigma factor n=1 Tax=Rapidithrix thailandica TaxID=413964 RepID=A0AAW9S3R9_9BACT